MKYTNIRYSTTLNDAQTDYLADECQDINRMKCFKTFLRMAVLEPTKVSKKHFSAVLQPGQFMASKVELSMMWGCNRKTATRIIKEFNLMGILESVPSNRTTIHTLKCLSVWFTNQGMVKNSLQIRLNHKFQARHRLLAMMPMDPANPTDSWQIQPPMAKRNRILHLHLPFRLTI